MNFNLNATNSGKQLKSFLDNVYVSGALQVFLIIYATLAAPKLPAKVTRLFHVPLVQMLIFALIAYTATKNLSVSLLLSVAFFLSFHSYTRVSTITTEAETIIRAAEAAVMLPEEIMMRGKRESDAAAYVRYASLDKDPVMEALQREATF